MLTHIRMRSGKGATPYKRHPRYGPIPYKKVFSYRSYPVWECVPVIALLHTRCSHHGPTPQKNTFRQWPTKKGVLEMVWSHIRKRFCNCPFIYKKALSQWFYPVSETIAVVVLPRIRRSRNGATTKRMPSLEGDIPLYENVFRNGPTYSKWRSFNVPTPYKNAFLLRANPI